MKRIASLSLLTLSLSLPAYAMHKTYLYSDNWWSPSRLYIGAYGGYGNVSGAYKLDGQVTQGRLVLGLHAGENHNATIGTELGVESGNDMRLQANPALIDTAGGLPIQATLKPMADLLITLEAPFSDNYPIIGILKGGIAYRQMQYVGRSSARDTLRKVNPELQVGLGVTVTQNAMLTVFYQGVYGGSSARPALNSINDVTISRIPTQQAIFLGLEYSMGGQTHSSAFVVESNPVYMPPARVYQHKVKHTPVKTAENTFHDFTPAPFVKTVKPVAAKQTAQPKAAPIKTASKPAAKKVTNQVAVNKAVHAKTPAKLSAKKSMHIQTADKHKVKHAAKQISAKKSAAKTLAHAAKSKTAKPVIHAANKPAPAKPADTHIDASNTLAQADSIVIDKPALNFDLMSETIADENSKKETHDSREVLV